MARQRSRWQENGSPGHLAGGGQGNRKRVEIHYERQLFGIDTSVPPAEEVPEMPPPTPPPCQHGLWLSPTEQAVVNVATEEYQPAKALAEKAGLIVSEAEL